VDDFEATLEGSDINSLTPNCIEVEVAGNDDLLGADGSHLSELVFGHERFLLAYLLEDSEHEGLFFFDIIDEDCLLVGITIPVFGLILLIKVRVELEGGPSFADSW